MSQSACYVGSAKAVFQDGFLITHATIEVTATNYEPFLKRNPILIVPPPHEFFAREDRTADVGGRVILPKPISQTFPTPGGKPDAIAISAPPDKMK